MLGDEFTVEGRDYSQSSMPASAKRRHLTLVLPEKGPGSCRTSCHSLYRMAVETGAELPPFFSSSAWGKHQNSVISTSNCSKFGPSIITVGFGAVCADGYGVGYVLKPGNMYACITPISRVTQTRVVTW